MRRRLVIADHYDSPALPWAAAAAARGDTVDVLLLGLSWAWCRWQYPDRAALLTACRIVDAAALADASHDHVRTFVTDCIDSLPGLDLGGTTLQRLLHDEDGNTWWYLETSEKGPYRGPLVGQLYKLALVRTAVDGESYDEIAFSLRDRQLGDVLRAPSGSGAWTDLGGERAATAATALEDWPALRYCTHAAAATWGLLAAWALTRACDPRRLRRGERIVFTAFPAWWAGATGDAPRERFMAAADRTRIGGYLALLTSAPRLWRYRQAVRRTADAQRIVFLQEFLTWRDLRALAGVKRFRRLLAFRRLSRRGLRARFAGFEVGPLIARDIVRSLSGAEPFQDVLLARAVRRAVQRLAPAAIVYRAEFQPAENALLRGSADQTFRVGFVHFPFGENYLPIRFAAGEVARHLARQGDPDARPFPDGFIASGAAIAAHVTDGGFPPGRVALCGPLRYDALVAYRRARAPRAAMRDRLQLAADATIVFVALAIVEADTEALFGALVDAGAGAANLHFLIRTHPNRPAGDRALRTTLASLGAEHASLVPPNAAIYDYIAAADAMVCIGSMIAFEAMALEVMPIVFDNPATYGAVSLAEYRDGLYVVRTADELRAAIRDVTGNTAAAAAKRRAWPGVLSRVLGDLERPAGEQFTAALDALGAPRGSVH